MSNNELMVNYTQLTYILKPFNAFNAISIYHLPFDVRNKYQALPSSTSKQSGELEIGIVRINDVPVITGQSIVWIATGVN